MSFDKLKLIDPIQKAITDKGYDTPTKIQAQAIPQVLERKDVLGIAQTGTGKTAAFSIPIIQLIHRIDGNRDKKNVLRALILTPTRELAIQIDENIRAYNKYTRLRHTVIFGGVKQGKQVNSLKQGVQILVATPGRLLDLISQGYISLDDLKIFVLDEADRMLDMGFIHDIKKLTKLLPKKRQTLFFSATMPDHIIALSSDLLHQPVRVEVARKSSPAEAIKQYVYYTDKNKKIDLLHHILKNEIGDEQILIFGRTKHGSDKLARKLRKLHYKVGAIHGNKSQNQRQNTLKGFKDKKIKLLVATDIAARGIDINKLRYVINFDVPNVPETYVHRIGRSGRAGEDGIAISISEPEENAYVKAIERLIKNSIEVVEHPFPQTTKPMTEKEKKAWNKEKQRRKQEFFAARKKAKMRR